jgi:hypothetical protein
LDGLPNGIHSGLMKPRAKGLFFYFQAPAPEGGGKLHFWKYYDLVDRRIFDNRFIIANLIACDRDTPRVTRDYDERPPAAAERAAGCLKLTSITFGHRFGHNQTNVRLAI